LINLEIDGIPSEISKLIGSCTSLAIWTIDVTSTRPGIEKPDAPAEARATGGSTASRIDLRHTPALKNDIRVRIDEEWNVLMICNLPNGGNTSSPPFFAE
jgi:hypothetical protein